MHPISVIIPTLNEERYLPTLLSSLLRCTFKQMEIIVVDGKSGDDTQKVVKEFQHKAPPMITVRLLVSNRRNVSYQRNLGASKASHNTLLFLDADTLIPSPEKLRELLARFAVGGYGAATCRFMPLEPDLRAMLYFAILYIFHKIMEWFSPYALGACIITTKETWMKVNGFDPSIKVNEDANFVMKAKRFGGFKVLPVSLEISTRRFKKHGYLRMGLQYVRIFFRRTFRGELKDGTIEYQFGHYD